MKSAMSFTSLNVLLKTTAVTHVGVTLSWEHISKGLEAGAGRLEVWDGLLRLLTVTCGSSRPLSMPSVPLLVERAGHFS